MIRYTKDGKVDRGRLRFFEPYEIAELADALDAANARIAELERPATSDDVATVLETLGGETITFEGCDVIAVEPGAVEDARFLIARLDRERQEMDGEIAKFGPILNAEMDRAEKAEAALAEARKDQQRYRWFRDHQPGSQPPGWWLNLGALSLQSTDAFDAAIDAAIAREGQQRKI